MPPMTSKLSLALITAFLLSIFPIAFSPHAEAAGEGVHPYDRTSRHLSQVHVVRSRSRLVYDNPYYRRTETHALHPYFRNSYYSILNVDRTRRDTVQDGYQLVGFPFYRAPSATSCGNHSYFRPNYRTPPSDFRCIRH